MRSRQWSTQYSQMFLLTGVLWLPLASSGCKSTGLRSGVRDVAGAGDDQFPHCFDASPASLAAAFGDSVAACQVSGETALTALYQAAGVSLQNEQRTVKPTCSNVNTYLRSPRSQIVLDLSGQHLKCTMRGALAYLGSIDQPNIIGLNLAGNELSSDTIPWRILPSLDNTLRSLDLSHNNYNGSWSGFFNDAKLNAHLQVLDASYNKFIDVIATGESGSLEAFSQTLYLDASHNQLTKVVDDFHALSRLAYLDVGNQQAGVMAAVIFHARATADGFTPLMDLAHLGIDNTAITQTNLRNPAGDFGGFVTADSLSYRRNPLDDGSTMATPQLSASLTANADMVDVRGWGSALQVSPYSAQDGGFAGVWRDSCAASGACKGPLLLGGCLYAASLRQAAVCVEAEDLPPGMASSDFKTSIEGFVAGYKSICPAMQIDPEC